MRLGIGEVEQRVEFVEAIVGGLVKCSALERRQDSHRERLEILRRLRAFQHSLECREGLAYYSILR
ncbi:MAG: hypothetical protein IPM35_00095 [Myxococcales bacterium]|nr:hypothetical protein [Myxococcales bacterium]